MNGRPKRRWWRCLAAFLVTLAIVIGGPILAIESLCPGSATATARMATPPPGITEAGYRRPEVNTYFTFPEWYIVYSFEDFGRFLERGSESGFPYLGHIAGFWQSFCTINRLAGGRAESLTEMKVMVYTIAISYSLELAIKGLYENAIGRITEWTRGPEPTPEDIYARAVAQDYAEVLHTVPWYKYPFLDKLRGLWAAAPNGGPDVVRRWERKLALSAEYLVKSGYAWAIGKALDVSSAPESRGIMLVTGPLPPEALAKEPRIKLLRALDAEKQLILVPRCKAFTEIVKQLASDNRSIVEIAGNDDILVTAILPDGPAPRIDGLRELFSSALGAKPGFRRAGFDVKVARLTRVIAELERAGATVEHVYDY